jgi:hypothetical protein
MATYEDVKAASIKLIDDYASHHEVVAGYGLPEDNPRYSASTKLSTLGVGVYVRRAMLKVTNRTMRKKFPDVWEAVGIPELEESDTLGAFIETMCACASVAVPTGEPS